MTSSATRQPKKIVYNDLPWAVEGVYSWEEMDGFVAEVPMGNDDDMNLFRVVLTLPAEEGLWGFDDGFAALACVSLHEFNSGGDAEIEVYPVREVQVVSYERDD